MNDSTIQHKQTFSPEPGFGFGDDGERVRIVMPGSTSNSSTLNEDEAAQVRTEAISRLMLYLLGEGTAQEIGRKVLIIGYLVKLPAAPQTQSGLAARVGVSPGRISQILSEIKTKIPEIAGILT